MLMWEIHILGRRNLMDAWESDCGGDRDDPAVQGACPASDRPFGKATRDLVSDIDGMGAAAAAEVLYTKDGKVNAEWQRLDNNLPSIDRIISAFYDNKGKKPADWYGCFNVQLVHWQVRSRGAAHAACGGTDRGRFTGQPDQVAVRSAERHGDRVLSAPPQGRGRYRRQDHHQRPVNFAW